MMRMMMVVVVVLKVEVVFVMPMRFIFSPFSLSCSSCGG